MAFPDDMRVRSPAVAAPPPAPKPDENIHEVEPTDTLDKIGRDYGVDPQVIAERNNIADPTAIRPGTYLTIPKPETTPDGKLPPALLSPEAQRTETAAARLEQSEANLAALGTPTQADRHDPDYQRMRSQLQQDVTSKHSELKQAVEAEIKAGYQREFDARPTGAMYTAGTIEHYGSAIAQRHANDPVVKAEVESIVKGLKVDLEVNDVLNPARGMGDPAKSAAYVDKQLAGLSHEAQAALKNSDEVRGWRLEAGKRDGEALKKAWDEYQDATPSEKTQKMLAMREALKHLDGHAQDPYYGEGVSKALGADKIAEIVNGFYTEVQGHNPYITPGNLKYVREHLGPLSQAVGNADRNGTLPAEVRQKLLECDPARLSMFLGAGQHSDAMFSDATRMVIDKWGGMGNEYGKFALGQLMANMDHNPQAMKTLLADGRYSSDVRTAATAAVQSFSKDSVSANVDAFTKETEELSYYISNYGKAMTPQQLNDAIAEFTKTKGPEWEKKVAALEEKVAADGRKLLDQLAILDSAQGDQTLETVLKDPKAQYAVNLALKKDPGYVDTQAGKLLMQRLAYGAKIGEQGLKLGKELANAYIRNDVLAGAHEYDPRNPASIAKAEASIDKLKNPTFIKLMGLDVEGSKYKSYIEIVDNLKKTLAAPGDTTQDVVRKLKLHADTMNNLDNRLTAEGHRPTFEKNQPAGQLLRMVGLGFATMGFMNSYAKANDGKFTAKEDLKAIVDAAGLGQKGTELAVGLGMVAEDSRLGLFGAGNKNLNGQSIDPGRFTRADRIFGYLSAGFDAWNAGTSFASGDNTRGVLYTASAVGGTLAAVSGTSFAASLGIGAWAGPVGIAIVVLATLGLDAKARSDYANRFEHDATNGRSDAFLRHAGLNEATARALVDNSGEGFSVMPALMDYATAKGYDLSKSEGQQKFVAWLNGIEPGKLAKLRDDLHERLDGSDGDIKALAYATAKFDLGPSADKYSGPDLVRIGLPMVIGQLSLEHGVALLPSTGMIVGPASSTGTV